MHLVKYGVREHIDQFFRDGTVQIGTVISYDTETHGPMIGDDEEGLIFQTITDDTVHMFRARGDRVPPVFGAPGCSGNVVMQTNVSFNYAIYSLSHVLHRDLCRNFSADYDAAFFIDRPIVFFTSLRRPSLPAALSTRLSSNTSPTFSTHSGRLLRKTRLLRRW